MFASFHSLAYKTNNEHLPKPFFKVIRKSPQVPCKQSENNEQFRMDKQPVKFFSLSKIRPVMPCEGNLSHLTSPMASAKKKISFFFPWLPFIETICYLICIFYLLDSNGLPMNNEGNLAEEVEPGNKFPISILLQPIFQNWAKNKKDLFDP